MSRIFHQQILVSPPPPPPPLSNLQAASFDMDSKISPSILLIIVILAIIFFVSGLLHLLVRFLLRSPNREPEDFDDTTAFQGQLQQLFHLHDAGVDQSFIDTLPVFNYKQIIGIKNYPFDCAVCLCEFEDEDKLRLLPKCSHAFHMECIDTWLLSHSSCPLCRSLLLPDFSANNGSSPVLLVLESNESSREIVHDRDREIGSSHRGFAPNCDELGSNRFEFPAKSSEIATVKDAANAAGAVAIGEKVLPVKLGKFRNVGEGSNSTNGDGNGDNADARRCFSMGSFAYVMDENSSLQVPIRATPITKPSKKKPSHLPLTPGHRLAMSECDCESRRDFSAFDLIKSGDLSQANAIGKSKRESFSVSKIWMRSKRDKGNTLEDSSRRAFSMRFPMEDLKERTGGGRTNSEMGIGRWQSDGNQTVVCDSNNIIDAQAETPSFARRTLLWLVGKQSKVVHSSSETNAP